jgi:hypothetical protein
MGYFLWQKIRGNVMIIHWNWGESPSGRMLTIDLLVQRILATSDEGVPVALLGESIGFFRFDLGAHSCQVSESQTWWFSQQVIPS